MSVIDPNYSAYILFLLGVICDHTNHKLLRYIIWFLSLLTYSRNFILGLGIYIILKLSWLKKISSLIVKKIFRDNELYLSIFIFIFILITAKIFLFFSTDVNYRDYSTNTARFFILQDSSNYIRFEQYFAFFKSLIEFPSIFFFGITDIEYHQIPYIKVNPHNALLFLMRNFGVILGFFVYAISNRILFNNKVSKHIDFAISWFFYQSFFLAPYNSFLFLVIGVVIVLYRNEIYRKGVSDIALYQSIKNDT
ncbi:hypothetical protein [Fusobacterium necrophorum]|uniref:hypothetical protein n=1 Tax=Fusobacterium necrophorum TaxID=859 RepID=UPI0011C2322A|nr:hypothetical protein [Fusobacterium necrophorum]MCF0163577.1 hypothetical protein [Fusobacterium necrophorum]